MRKIATSAIALMVGLSAGSTVIAADEDSLVDALRNGDASIDMRYRLELVDQDGFDKNATASTLRTKLGYKTGTFQGFSGYLEFENSTVLGETSYNNTINGKTQYPVVADPASTEVNQAYLQYATGSGLTLKAGRQGINLGTQRYVGTVGWRQNDQTFDAAAAVYSKGDLTVVAGYVWNVNRIFSDDHPLGDLSTETGVVTASYKASDWIKVDAMALLINLDTAVVPVDTSLSSQTYSLRVSGAGKAGDDVKIGYALEYAKQGDYATNQLDYSADYWNAELSAATGGFTGKVGYELLGSDDGTSFKTPLATLHKFNGFADKFLGTPGNGLVDQYASVAYKVPGDSGFGGTSFMVAYHHFEADIGNVKYGHEIDWVIAKPLNKTFTLNLKGAHYNADMHATDTTKFWFTIGAKF